MTDDRYVIYFRPLLTPEGKVHICEMQWFDEYDYDKKRFLTDISFPSEEAARTWCLANEDLVKQKLHEREVFDE